ncbi:sodium-dependent glucose transporter 1 [Aplysia californica]|uniref:Sodium-dependent glucose transporter 1 n=1 Tax=Aplysia californica TaxID=6500 RepID=A0ABM1A9W8_APLCA|nr:sodium-dependent glucose transporter 1 [Aplysia californica]
MTPGTHRGFPAKTIDENGAESNGLVSSRYHVTNGADSNDASVKDQEEAAKLSGGVGTAEAEETAFMKEKMKKEAGGFWATLRQNIALTGSNSFALFVLGVMISMKGPTFLDIQTIADTDVEGGSAFVTAGAFGYMTGSLLAGGLYGRVEMKSKLMFVPLALSALSFALTPWCTDFVLMLVVHAAVSVFCAIFETTANTQEVHAWEGNSGSAMQFLSFSYSLGGIIGPLIAEPFLSSAHPPVDTGQPSTNVTQSLYNGSVTSNRTRDLPDNSSDYIQQRASGQVTPNYTQVDPGLGLSVDNSSSGEANNSTLYGLQPSGFVHYSGSDHMELVSNMTQSSDEAHFESNIHYAYLIGAILTAFAAIPFIVLYFRSRQNMKVTGQSSSSADSRYHRLPLRTYIFLAGVISAFYFFYTSVDDSFAQYLSVFVVTELGWSKEAGAEVSSLYWSCSTVTKLVMVLVVQRLNVSAVLLLSTVGMMISLVMISLFSLHKVHAMVWVSTACLALSQSAVFGGGFAWADTNLLMLDGKITSCVMIFSSLGAMVTPLFLGYMMKELSPMSFPYLLTAQSFVTFLLFVSMITVVKPIVTRKYGPPRPTVSCGEAKEEEDSESLRGNGVKNIPKDSVSKSTLQYPVSAFCEPMKDSVEESSQMI